MEMECPTAAGGENFVCVCFFCVFDWGLRNIRLAGGVRVATSGATFRVAGYGCVPREHAECVFTLHEMHFCSRSWLQFGAVGAA